LPDRSPARFCRTSVPICSDIEKMGLAREPVTRFAERSTGAEAMLALWQETRRALRL
jgi:hypothetical protein